MDKINDFLGKEKVDVVVISYMNQDNLDFAMEVVRKKGLIIEMATPVKSDFDFNTNMLKIYNNIQMKCNLNKSQEEFINKKETEKQAAIENELKQEELKKIEQVASKITFLKLLESIEILINEKEYEYALSRLDLHNNGSHSIQNGHDILFLKGKINYMRERYDLAINQLFKLVKEKYDYPEGFLYLGKAYEALGLEDKAKWAYERIK